MSLSERADFDPVRLGDYETLYAWAFNTMLECSALDDAQPASVALGGAALDFRDLERILNWALDKAHTAIEAHAEDIAHPQPDNKHG